MGETIKEKPKTVVKSQYVTWNKKLQSKITEKLESKCRGKNLYVDTWGMHIYKNSSSGHYLRHSDRVKEDEE